LVEMVGGGVVVAVPGATERVRSWCPARAQTGTVYLSQPDWRASAGGVDSNTSVAACFAARVRRVLWRSLGANHSIGSGLAFQVTESHIAQLPLADLPTPVSAAITPFRVKKSAGTGLGAGLLLESWVNRSMFTDLCEQLDTPGGLVRHQAARS